MHQVLNPSLNFLKVSRLPLIGISVSLYPNVITLSSCHCSHNYQYLSQLVRVFIWRRRFGFFASPLAAWNGLQDFLRFILLRFLALQSCELIIELFKVFFICGKISKVQLGYNKLSYNELLFKKKLKITFNFGFHLSNFGLSVSYLKLLQTDFASLIKPVKTKFDCW